MRFGGAGGLLMGVSNMHKYCLFALAVAITLGMAGFVIFTARMTVSPD
jgi:hypothetical protein